MTFRRGTAKYTEITAQLRISPGKMTMPIAPRCSVKENV